MLWMRKNVPYEKSKPPNFTFSMDLGSEYILLSWDRNDQSRHYYKSWSKTIEAPGIQGIIRGFGKGHITGKQEILP